MCPSVGTRPEGPHPRPCSCIPEELPRGITARIACGLENTPGAMVAKGVSGVRRVVNALEVQPARE
jgi:hypothetical protein